MCSKGPINTTLMKKKEATLTVEEAYLAMVNYLNDLYEITESDELGGLLGDMQFLEDGGTADPAVWGEWLIAVKRVKDMGVKQSREKNLLRLT